MVRHALLAVAFDPAADPWGTAMLAFVVVGGFVVLWGVVALLMRQPARGAGRVMSLALLGYLGSAVGGVVAKVRATPPPVPVAPVEPPVVIGAKVPADTEGKRDAKAEAKLDAKADAKAEPPPAEPPPAEPTPDAAPTPPAPTAVPEPTPREPVELGPPTLSGREALRFIIEVSQDEAKCTDAKQVAAAARELPGGEPEITRDRLAKAAAKLETCRRKIVWARAFSIRRNRIADREKLAEAIPERLKAQGIPVLVTLRGAAHERIRIGGAKLDQAKARELLDAGLRDELADAGFSEITLADMQGSVKETPTVPNDNDLATAELAAFGLDRKIELK
jgi:hypothetical protein